MEWYDQDGNDVPPIEPIPGQFCSQWLIRMAPLSLQYFNGPIYQHDVETVLTRFDHWNYVTIRPHFLLVPNPMDDIDYYYDEFVEEEDV